MNQVTAVTAYELQESDFSFRTNKETGAKRPTFTGKYPVLTAEGVKQALDSADKNVSVLVLDTVNGIFSAYVRGIVDADSEFTQEKLDALINEGKLSIETLANLPKSERNVLSKEDLEALAKDYIKFMPEITGKSKEKVTAAAGLLVERFKRCAGDDNVLKILQEQLGIFIDKAPAEVSTQHEKALTFLATKLDELLSVKVTAEAL